MPLWQPNILFTSYFMLIHNFQQNTSHLIIFAPTVADLSAFGFQFAIHKLRFHSDIHRSFDFVICMQSNSRTRRSYRTALICYLTLTKCIAFPSVANKLNMFITWLDFLLLADKFLYGQEWNESYNLPFAIISHSHKWKFGLFLLPFRPKEAEVRSKLLSRAIFHNAKNIHFWKVQTNFSRHTLVAVTH